MAVIDQISNGESGSSAREKINEAIKSVESDSTLTGDGTVSSPMGVTPGTYADASHVSDTSNPHSVTASQVGLGNVDDTADLDKPISTATQAALDNKSNIGHGHTASDISDFDTEVSNNADVVANTSKVSWEKTEGYACALSTMDEDLVADASTIKGYNHILYACTVSEFIATVKEAPTGAAITVVAKNGATTMATITIAIGATSGSTTTISSASVSAGDDIDYYITGVGSTETGKALQAHTLTTRT